CLAKLITALDHTLANCLNAVYLFGSASYGAYEPGISDLDVQAVISSPLPQSTYRELATQLGHSTIPCPARKLEFVLYTKDAVAAANPQFKLNFNTGDGMADYVCLDPSQEATHWFLLDIASGGERGWHSWGRLQIQCSLSPDMTGSLLLLLLALGGTASMDP
ncbi:hypothetical protein ARMSODRAFT_1065711, partial [Armillaria solidipes]